MRFRQCPKSITAPRTAGLLDDALTFAKFRMLLKHAGEVEGSLRIVFPEVGAMSKPIVVVFTGMERSAANHGLHDRFVASMKP